MKFTILDSQVSQSNRHNHHIKHDDKTYTDKYMYLDDLLDKTFLIDYFLGHNAADAAADALPTSNK